MLMTTAQCAENPASFDEVDLIALIPRMRSLARHLCHDATETEDLTQATLTLVWQSRARFTPGSNLKAWVLTIMRNQFYSGRRRAWRQAPMDQRLIEETLVAVSNPTAALELEDVRRAMLQLSEEHRKALSLISIAGLPYQQAADICGCPVGTIKSRLSRARQMLTHILATSRLTAAPRPAGHAMSAIIAGAERARVARHDAQSPERGRLAA